MKMNREEAKNAVAAYCLGILDDDEKAPFEEYLKQGDAEIVNLVREMRKVIDSLALSAPVQEPPPALKQNVLSLIQPQAITGEEVTSHPIRERIDEVQLRLLQKARDRWMRLSWVLAVAVVAVGIGLGVYAGSLRQQLASQAAELAAGRGKLQSLQVEMTELRRLRDLVNSPNIRMVNLEGQKPAPAAKATVIWEPVQKEAIFYAFNLPQTADDKDYQLWMIKDNKPVDAGVFSVDARGFAKVKLDDVVEREELGAFAVTLEPKGGVRQPTGAMFLVGSVNI